MRLPLLFASALLLAASARAEPAASETSSHAKEPEGPIRVAVPVMGSTETDAELAQMLTDILAVEARKVEGLEVIGMSDIESLLGFEQKKQLVGCDDIGCMAEIGGALGVGHILASKVGRVGDTYVLTLRIIDTRAVKVINSTYDTVAGKPDALISRIRHITPELLKPLVPETEVDPAIAANGGNGNGNGRPEPATVSEVGGLKINWAALGITGCGMLSLIASGVVGVLALGAYNNYDTTVADIEINGRPYHAEGSHAATVDGNNMSWLFLSVALVGVAATVGGVAWQLMAQQPQEATP